MKIGTITYHKSYNYGSALQAYALNRYLRNNGYEAEVINYHSTAQDSLYNLFEPVCSLMSVVRNIQSIFEYKNLKTHKKRFDAFIDAYIRLSKDEYNEDSDLRKLNEEYTHFICGSDQIWNPSCADFTDAYLLSFVCDKKKCFSYAASLGKDSIDELWREKFKECLSQFGGIAVREESGRRVISDLLDRDVDIVPDPVILLSADEWLDVSVPVKIKGKYILCYFIGDVEGMRYFAQKMKKKTGLQLVVIYKNIRDVLYKNKKYYSCGPREFISLVKNCEYVCTNSFHAVMFSLIFEKNFWVFEDLKSGSAKSRIETITARTHLEHRVLNSEKRFPENVEEKIDYSGIKAILESLAKTGREYIEKCLEVL